MPGRISMPSVEVAASPECATLTDLRDQTSLLIRMYSMRLFGQAHDISILLAVA